MTILLCHLSHHRSEIHGSTLKLSCCFPKGNDPYFLLETKMTLP